MQYTYENMHTPRFELLVFALCAQEHIAILSSYARLFTHMQHTHTSVQQICIYTHTSQHTSVCAAPLCVVCV